MTSSGHCLVIPWALRIRRRRCERSYSPISAAPSPKRKNLAMMPIWNCSESTTAIVRSELDKNDGREVKHTGDGIMAAFTSVVSAVAFAVEVQRRLHERNQAAAVPFEVRIGISAGEPVTDDHDDLFGAAVQLAARLCAVALLAI